jgi:hypothetical protein
MTGKENSIRDAVRKAGLSKEALGERLKSAELALDRARNAAQSEAAGDDAKVAYEIALKAKLAILQELKMLQLSEETPVQLRLVYSSEN